MRDDDGPYLPQELHLLLGDVVHHAQVVDELLHRGDAVLLEGGREDVELTEVPDDDVVAALLQYLEAEFVDVHPAYRVAFRIHVACLPAEDLEETVGILAYD